MYLYKMLLKYFFSISKYCNLNSLVIISDIIISSLSVYPLDSFIVWELEW